MSCRTCKYLNVPLDKAGRRVVRGSYAYPCTAPDTPQPQLPVSITEAYGFKWPPPRQWVTPAMGASCPLHEHLQKEQA